MCFWGQQFELGVELATGLGCCAVFPRVRGLFVDCWYLPIRLKLTCSGALEL